MELFVAVFVVAVLLILLSLVEYHYGFHYSVLLTIVLLFVYFVGRYHLRILVTVNMLVILFLVAEIALNVLVLTKDELVTGIFFVFILISLLMRDLHRVK